MLSLLLRAQLCQSPAVTCVSWSPDGQVLACPSGEHIYLWAVATGERQALAGHIGGVTAALFNHQGDLPGLGKVPAVQLAVALG